MDREAALLRSNRRLRAAVWILSIVMLAGFVWQYATKTLFFYSPQADPDALIKAASVIVYSDNKVVNNEIHPEIREILLLRPGVTFYYKVGDSFPMLGPEQQLGPVESHSEGQIVFLVGSPASFKESVSVYDGRLGALGDMPMDVLKEKIAAAASR